MTKDIARFLKVNRENLNSLSLRIMLLNAKINILELKKVYESIRPS